MYMHNVCVYEYTYEMAHFFFALNEELSNTARLAVAPKSFVRAAVFTGRYSPHLFGSIRSDLAGPAPQVRTTSTWLFAGV